MRAEDPWAWPETARAYAQFNRSQPRYRVAAEALAKSLGPLDHVHILDVGAGTGVSGRALLKHAGEGARLTAVEPSRAMRAACSLRDRRLTWTDAVPEARFDVVVCCAALWLMGPMLEAISALAARVADDGVLAFTVPAAFVGLPDGAPDDRTSALDALVSAFVRPRTQSPAAVDPLPDHRAIDAQLEAIGFDVARTEAQSRWTMKTQEQWLRLPPVGLAMRPDLALADLDAAVDAALTEVGRRRGHRVERWEIWSARRC